MAVDATPRPPGRESEKLQHAAGAREAGAVGAPLGHAQPLGRPRDRRPDRARGAARAGDLPGAGPNHQDLLNTLQPPSWPTRSAPTTSGATSSRGRSTPPGSTCMVGADHDVRAARARRAARSRRRLPRRVARDRRHARRRRRRRVPVHRARDRGDRDRRARAARRLHRHHRRRLGALRAPDARRGARAEGPAVRARGDEPRLLAHADDVPAHPPERDPAEPRLLDARHRAQHPRARLALVPRPRRAAAGRRMGADGRRGADVPAHRLVDLDAPGPRDRARRRRLQPRRRRPRRPTRHGPPRRAGENEG